MSPLDDTSIERTEIEWPYRPHDFFESGYRLRSGEFDLVADAGRVVITLNTPQDPLPDQLRDRLHSDVEGLFLLRQLQVHRKFELENPRVYQHHTGGRRSVAVSVGGNMSVGLISGHVDVVVRDAEGNIRRDTKAERIREHTRSLHILLPKVRTSSALRSMLASYRAATNDPDNELVHLYEIRDALVKHYGTEREARSHLGISKAEWQRLGFLANKEPLKEGRHRGAHPSALRPASAVELSEARGTVRRWITAFATGLN